jgi:hypothetical protein
MTLYRTRAENPIKRVNSGSCFKRYVCYRTDYLKQESIYKQYDRYP